MECQMDLSKLIIKHGWDIKLKNEVAELYDEAFGQKIALAIPVNSTRRALLAECFDPKYSVIAIHENKIVGIAGFKTNKGSFTDSISYFDLIKKLGLWAGNWATFIFYFYEQEPIDKELFIDGIAVHPDFRGKGIGTKLLENIVSHANKNDYNKVKLEVIDTNTRARELYEKQGFKHFKTEHFPYLRWLLGFGGSTTLERNT